MNINEDNARCDGCGKRVNLDATPPCPHGTCVCDMCDPETCCADCFMVGAGFEDTIGEVPC